MAHESSLANGAVVANGSLAANQTIGGDECDLLIGNREDEEEEEEEAEDYAMDADSVRYRETNSESSFLNKLFSFFNKANSTDNQRNSNHHHQQQQQQQDNGHDYHDQFSHSKRENWLFERDEVVHYSRARDSFEGEDITNYLEEEFSAENASKSSFSGQRSSYGVLSGLAQRQSMITTIKRSRRVTFNNLLLFLLISLCLLATVGLIFKLSDLIGGHRRELEYSLNIAYNAPKLDQELSQHVASRWLVSSPKCHIPVIDPWHQSIESYVTVKSPLNCTKVILEDSDEGSKFGPALTYVQDNRLYFNMSNLWQLKQSNRSHYHKLEDIFNSKYPKCCYKTITRGEENDDGVLVNKTCIDIFNSSLEAPFSLIRVECKDFNYTNVHTFTIDDIEEELALDRISMRKLNKMNHYNILMVGVDTISRLNGHRQLSKTLKTLNDKFKTLEFLGYNKVGENTFPNLIPLLTGLTPEQLTETNCWLASNYSQETEQGDDFLDNCKYLWNYYQEIGYTTYFSEDWPAASTFNYLKQGFRKEPTSFYGRPFTLARDKLLLPKGSCASCLLDEPIVKVDLESLKTFIKLHADEPYFAFHWINCPQHDDLNGASQIDHILEKFFNDIIELTQQRRTFVIFFSDHGYRWNNFVSTRIGHYESSLPMLTIAAPEHFIKNQPKLYENLKQHRSALITPFDMFKTLVAIRNLSMKDNEQVLNSKAQQNNSEISSGLTRINNDANATNSSVVTKRQVVSTSETSANRTTPSPSSTLTTTFKQLKPMDGVHYKQKFRTISLLDEHTQTELDRSCIGAGIPDNYCVCHEFEKTSVESDDVLGAAYYYVYVHLYNRIKDQTNICSQLDLELVHEAEIFDFKRMKVEKGKSRRRKRDRIDEDGNPDDDGNSNQKTTTPKPELTSNQTSDELQIDESHYLPNREYNIRISTLPSKGLFQEVVRFYGDDLNACQLAVKEAKLKLDANHVESSSSSTELELKTQQEKHDSVMSMNKVCRFSIHSDSISRLNLYKDQSKCVKSNIELKKICYCK